MTDKSRLRRCEPHGLTYDPVEHDGCTLCRKASLRAAPPAQHALERVGMIAIMVLWVAGVLFGFKEGFTRMARLRDTVTEGTGGDAPPVPPPPEVNDVVAALAHTVPKEMPFVRRDGKDAFGHPRDYVDKVGLVALLLNRRYAELTGHIESLQDASEKDVHAETWILDALKAFETADPRLSPALDGWVVANTSSFSAVAARGRHRLAMAWYFRGNDFAEKAGQNRLEAMRSWLALADADARQALELRPKLLAATSALMMSASMRGRRDEIAKLAEAALRDCPRCFHIRDAYMITLEPRWGGSFKEMEALAVAAQQHVSQNARLRVLLGETDGYRCDRYRLDKNYIAALEACDHALLAGPSPEVLYDRARTLKDLGRPEEALKDAEAAVDLRPEDANALTLRGVLLVSSGKQDEGFESIKRAVALDPLSSYASKSFAWALERSVPHGGAEAANAVYEAAAGQNVGDAATVYSRAVSRLDKGDAVGAIADLEIVTRMDPTHRDAFLKLDGALAPRREFSRIVAHWDRYIAVKPDDPRGYFERGGAQFHAGNTDRALADLQKACDMGYSNGCSGVAHVRQRTGAR